MNACSTATHQAQPCCLAGPGCKNAPQQDLNPCTAQHSTAQHSCSGSPTWWYISGGKPATIWGGSRAAPAASASASAAAICRQATARDGVLLQHIPPTAAQAPGYAAQHCDLRTGICQPPLPSPCYTALHRPPRKSGRSYLRSGRGAVLRLHFVLHPLVVVVHRNRQDLLGMRLG